MATRRRQLSRRPRRRAGLKQIPNSLQGADVAAGPLLQYLLDSYRHAVQMADAQGLDGWPKQIVHADWHPGNMLFRDNHVVAVIDYDSSRLLPRIIDAANGALQFSIIGGDEDISKWPEYLDESRYKRFLRGYDEVMLLSEAEIRTIPWLMIEALIAEAVFPIAATGFFGKMEGMAFLRWCSGKSPGCSDPPTSLWNWPPDKIAKRTDDVRTFKSKCQGDFVKAFHLQVHSPGISGKGFSLARYSGRGLG